ncbi:NUDIX hydrolase [Sphingomonas xinjiangensis]|uniref:8-oxo-dGTP pyrophosphatase MutT (NUDIX family) n=1 Tax=Sphingomonas xinjiangensis TaxID=643568 RepID=A0A840YAC8_9SPHN|nr:NUDIX domain-containing protein [Sphingomonas xinjiangensis]MBB5709804.1 8-oxo-dGTP pyrophosphatase MutT (NUDIX family) [Sphingomonas xinjiangensis]
MADQTPIPAATLIVMREAAAGPPELLMVERARTMAFAGGALVFPGGRVDPGDRVVTATLAGGTEELAARVGAIRETLEEAGIAVGLRVPDATAVRAALPGGAALAELVTRAGGAFDLDALVPFARWLPDKVPHRIFDTRFYLARAPHGATPAVDGTENVRAFWATASDVLGLADAGEATLIFPTRRNLERLAMFASFEEAAAHARAHPVRIITPWIEVRDGVEHLCIPADAGYPVTAERLDRAVRA